MNSIYIKIVLGTYQEHLQNAISFEGKILKKSAKMAKKLNFTNFRASYFKVITKSIMAAQKRKNC